MSISQITIGIGKSHSLSSGINGTGHACWFTVATIYIYSEDTDEYKYLEVSLVLCQLHCVFEGF